MQNQRLFFLLLVSMALPGCKEMIKDAPKPASPVPAVNTTILAVDERTADSINITPYLEMYPGTALRADTTTRHKSLWQKCGESLLPGTFTETNIRWFRFTLNNNTPQLFNRLLCFNDLDVVVLDYFSPKPQQAGTIVSIKDWSYGEDNCCLVLYLPAAQTKTFYLRCNRGNAGDKHPVRFILRTVQNEGNFQAFEIRSRMADTSFLFFYLGFLFFCFIYFLVQFLFSRNEKILVVYALYILFTLLYSFRDVDKHYFLQTAFPAVSGINIWGEAIFSYLSYICYSLFIVCLFNVKKERKWAYRFIVSAISVMTVLLFADVMLRLSGNHQYALALFLQSRLLLFPMSVLYFLLVMPFRGSYYVYFTIGLTFLLLGTGVNLSVLVLRNYPVFIFYDAITSTYGFWGNPVNYTRLGVIAEILFFSLGLAKKMRVEFATAVLEQDTAIENRFHTHEVKSGLLTLRSKLDNEPEAVKYLNMYRDYLLKALIIMKSKTAVELVKEIDMARAYFTLRHEDDNRFGFNFTNITAMDTRNILIPAGLLIPFIQNFFDHAITDSRSTYQFELLLYREGKKINLDITDDGKGIESGAVFNKTGSHGLDIARRKITLYNTLSGSKIDFTIGNNKPSGGTLIKITNLPKKPPHDKSHIG